MVENDNPLPRPQGTVVEPTPGPTTQPTSDSPIRKVDFRNFGYTGPDDYPESFTLKNGEKEYVDGKEDGIVLDKVTYDDLTGDGQEEALVVMTIQTGGSAIPHLVFVYAVGGTKPNVLLKFVSGDRAEGGLKDVYPADGRLVVELFGENKFAKGTWEADIPEGKFRGLCCPTIFTKTKFKWDGKQFAVEGTPEIFDVSE